MREQRRPARPQEQRRRRAALPREQRPHFDRAVNVGFAVAAAFFALLSAVSYYYYGSCVCTSYC